MIKLGLTGNIASGKSLIEDFFKENGIKTIDADKIVHNLLENDEQIINKVQELFNHTDITDENGKISRKKIGNIVFNDKTKLKQLENILHPRVKDKIKEFFIDNTIESIVVVAVPLLYETNMENMFDFVILVAADEEIRIERLLNRNNYSREEALNRINAQINQQEKINKADFVIYNNNGIDETKSRFEEIFNKLKNLI